MTNTEQPAHPAPRRAYAKPSLTRRDMLPAITADQVLISGINDQLS